MPCNHKLQNELYLEGIDYKPDTLIVGTFNPEWPAGNQAEWFYGRTHDEYGNQNNNFWEVLPRLYGHRNLINDTPEEWKTFCRDKSIAITDLVYTINDAIQGNPAHEAILRTYGDKEIAEKFNQQVPVDIVRILQANPSIQNVYLTRSASGKLWGKLWTPIRKHAGNHPNIRIQPLITPSGYAYFQHGKWNNENPDNQIERLADYILMRWQQVWHQLDNH